MCIKVGRKTVDEKTQYIESLDEVIKTFFIVSNYLVISYFQTEMAILQFEKILYCNWISPN